MPANKESVLIIDDDKEVLKLLKTIVERMGFKVTSVSDCVAGLNLLKEGIPDLLITDLMMQPIDGISILKEAKAMDSEVMVLILTGRPEWNTAVDAMKQGAFDYIEKPINMDRLMVVINKAIDRKRLVDENRYLRTQLDDRYKFDNIIGHSSTMRNIYATIEKVAPTNAGVLISGESGTGKEMIARAIHTYSLRKDKEFVAVDCVALPAQLIESELFGHEKGAFTGANSSREGLLESAQKGTFFMDEITELDFDLQAKLLRMLQERQFRRVGGRDLIDIDIRIISATNRDPEQAVKDGKLREDLFYRLNVIPIKLSPLRERREDIPLLVNHFLKTMKNEMKAITTISPDALEILQNYSWPGNIRELKNIVERLSILASGEKIEVGDLPHSITDDANANVSTSYITALPFKHAKEKWLEDFEKRYLEQILEEHNGNITQAANSSGVNRKTFQRLIAKYEIENYKKRVPQNLSK